MRALVALIVLSVTACTSEPLRLAAVALEENVQSTDYTARVEVVDVRHSGEPEPGQQFVEVIVTARVIDTYRGEELERIDYRDAVEHNESLSGQAGRRLIVSLCRATDGSYYIPEIGFALNDHARLRKVATRASAAAAVRDRICD